MYALWEFSIYEEWEFSIYEEIPQPLQWTPSLPMNYRLTKLLDMYVMPK